MAVTVTLVEVSEHSAVFDIKATADADAVATIPHLLGGFPYVPKFVSTIGLLAVPKTVGLTSIDATNVVLALGVAVGSGNAANQLRVFIRRPAPDSRGAVSA